MKYKFLILSKITEKHSWIYNLILDFIFPPLCFYCKRVCFNNHLLCEECRTHLISTQEKDGLFVQVVNQYYRSYALFSISALSRDLIYGIKYQGVAKLIDSFFAYSNLDWRWFSDCLLVPVPLHSGRNRERGYNQALLIAQVLSKYCNAPVLDCLKRVKYTKSQTGFSKNERMKNISNVITLKSNSHKLRDRKIIIIDDVFTTGATMSACIKKIQEQGASWIGLFSIIRAHSENQEDDFSMELYHDLLNRN